MGAASAPCLLTDWQTIESKQSLTIHVAISVENDGLHGFQLQIKCQIISKSYALWEGIIFGFFLHFQLFPLRN